MKLKFDPDALEWMGSHGFGVGEVSQVAELLGVMKRNVESGERFLVPKKLDERVSALVSILYAVTGPSGTPTCFTDDAVTIPEEAKRRFREALEISKEEKEVGEVGGSELFKEHLSKAKRRTGLRGK